MVKIYKGVVVYQNIGNVVIPDAQVDDLKVNNIATINTLDVLDTLGLSNIKINSGTITKYPVNQFDIVNKKYVDDNEGAFDPTQHIILTGNPDSLTVKNKSYFTGETNFDGNIKINTDMIRFFSSSNELKIKPMSIMFTNNNNTEIGNIGSYSSTSLLRLSAYNDNNTYTDRKLLLLSGAGYSLNWNAYNKGILIDNSGLEIKGNTTFDNDITAGTGTNQIKLDTVNGNISGKTLTLTEGIEAGTIKAGSGSNQITLDSQTGGISGKTLTISGSSTFNYNVSLQASNLLLNSNAINRGYRLSYNNKVCYFEPESHTGDNDGYRMYTMDTDRSLHLYAGASHYSDTNAKGLRISYANGVEVKGDTTLSGNLTAGTGTNQIKLDTSNGKITGNRFEIGYNYLNNERLYVNNGTIQGNDSVLFLSATSDVKGIEVSYNSKPLSIKPENDTNNWAGYRIYAPYSDQALNIYAGANHFNSSYAKGLRISYTNGIEVKGDTTFNNNVSLTTGTISTAPSNSNDIANKAYVDTVATSGFDPTSTMTLTNSNSLITNGDITNKTLIKTIEGEGTFSSIETVEFIMNYVSSQPAGFFYDPKHNKIMTIKISSSEANIYMYDLSTNSSSLVRITDGTYTFMTVKSFQGRYDYINDTITIMICGLTNEGSPRKNCYTFYDYDNNSFSSFTEISSSSLTEINGAVCSNDTKYYYFYGKGNDNTYKVLVLDKTNNNTVLSSGIALNSISHVYSFDTNETERLILITTDTQLFLYKHSSNLTLYHCHHENYVNDSNTKYFITGEDNKSCYIYSSKIIYRCEIIKTSSSPYYSYNYDVYYDNSSSNNSYSSGIVNYDGSLYMLSKYTTDNTITIEQFMHCNNQLKLIASKTYSDMDKSSPNYCILVKNQLYFITYKGSGQMPFYLRKISKLNNSSIISSKQTSLNGNIKFDEEINIDDYPKDINEVITYGKLLKILKNITISGSLIHDDCWVNVGGTTYWGELAGGGFNNGKIDFGNMNVNYNKYISSCK